MRKGELERLLTERLHLKDPEFRLRKIGTKWSGHVISDTFKGKPDLRRLNMVWGALTDELGAAAYRVVGTLLLYTRAEWNLDLPGLPSAKTKRIKKAG